MSVVIGLLALVLAFAFFKWFFILLLNIYAIWLTDGVWLGVLLLYFLTKKAKKS